jgi:hypothetical protein
MKSKIILTVLPCMVGILSVLASLLIYNLVIGNEITMRSPDILFFTVIVPGAFVCAMLIQYLWVIPAWNRFKQHKKLFGMGLIPLIGTLSILGGFVFSFIFWNRNDGIHEWICISITGMITTGIYCISNLFMVKQIDRIR